LGSVWPMIWMLQRMLHTTPGGNCRQMIRSLASWPRQQAVTVTSNVPPPSKTCQTGFSFDCSPSPKSHVHSVSPVRSSPQSSVAIASNFTSSPGSTCTGPTLGQQCPPKRRCTGLWQLGQRGMVGLLVDKEEAEEAEEASAEPGSRTEAE